MSIESCEDVATGTTTSDVSTALSTKMAELEVQKQVILEQRNAEIQAAREKYAEALKEITKKQGALKRMLKTSEKL
jgi:hypothetical protein